MPEPGWKKFETRIAEYFPEGRRRGADTRDKDIGKTDVISPGWSIECKLLKTVSFQILLDAAIQAETNQPEPDDIPIAIVKESKRHDKNALAVFRWATFMEYFNPRVTGPGWGMSYLPARRPTLNQILKAVKEAEDWSATRNTIPVAKIEKFGTDDVLAVMRFESFVKHFI